jgi:hypothetical protein
MFAVIASTCECYFEIACFVFHPAHGTVEMILVKTLQESDEIQKTDQDENRCPHPVYHILPYKNVH